MSLKQLTYQSKQGGFTIPELMFTLLIAAILLAIGVPAFDDLIRSNKTTSEYNRLIGDLNFARSEGIKRNTSIAMCPTTNSTACSGSDWETGWLVFVDDGAGGGTADNRDIDGSEELLRVGIGSPDGIDIATINFTDSTGILFTSDGKMENGNLADIGQVVICDDAGDTEAKGITFSAFGQFRAMRDTDGDDIVDYGDPPTNVGC